MNINQIIEKATIKSRIGYANNSSSSHSIVIHNGKLKNISTNCEYGWGDFVLTDNDEKEDYMILQLISNLQDCLDFRSNNFPIDIYDTIKEFEKSLVKSVLSENNIERLITENDYIDHQSEYTLPVDTKGNLSINFWRDLTKYILRNKIAILGGNDNGTSNLDYTNITENVNLPIPQDTRCCRQYVIKDDFSDTWILKDTKFGSIHQLDFNQDNAPVEGKKTGFPLLVDINITRKCDNGCKHCYLDCTSKGKEANSKEVAEIIEILNKLGTPDIVIGGGNILTYKDISTIHYAATEYKPRSLATTIYFKDIVDLDNDKAYKLGRFDSIAITFNKDDSIDRYCETFNNLRNHSYTENKDLVAQIIFEQYNNKELLELLAYFYEKKITTISFIGYKQCGRAKKDMSAKIKRIQDSDIFDQIVSLKNMWFSIYFDAVMVERYGHKLKVNKKFLAGKDGVHSCYIDAVNKTISRNSYSEEKHPYTKFNEEEFINIWRKL